MPRRKAQVNLTDARRLARAFKLEGIDFRATLQPGGFVVYEPAVAQADDDPADLETSEDVRKLL
jgi:hypothetical protein